VLRLIIIRVDEVLDHTEVLADLTTTIITTNAKEVAKIEVIRDEIIDKIISSL
jgi:hypothetical protein